MFGDSELREKTSIVNEGKRRASKERWKGRAGEIGRDRKRRRAVRAEDETKHNRTNVN